MNFQLETKNILLHESLLQKCEHDLLIKKEQRQCKEIEKMSQQMQSADLAHKNSYSYKMKEIYELVPKNPSYYLRILLHCLLMGNSPNFKVLQLVEMKQPANLLENLFNI